MAVIASREAKGLFTKMLVDVYKSKLPPTSFLRSFFPTVEAFTRYVSIEVEREAELMAVDVLRGTEGNINAFSKSKESIYEPPYYREKLSLTSMDIYDQMFGGNDVNEGVFVTALNQISDKIVSIINKIERRYEYQCAEVLTTGIVTMDAGTNVDFGRAAASKVAYAAGNDFSIGTVNPYTVLQNGCDYLRGKGKMSGGVVNVLMGTSAYNAFLHNDIVQKRADIRNISLDAIRTPQKNSVGGVLQGTVSVGSYQANIWTYPESYDTLSAGVTTQNDYINKKDVIIIPENPRFKLAFAAVPKVAKMGEAQAAPNKGSYHVNELVDELNDNHFIDVKSAGIAIPTAVDQIYTAKVLA